MNVKTKHVLVACALIACIFAVWKFAPKEAASAATGGIAGTVASVLAAMFV
jgi:hypothetical protein